MNTYPKRSPLKAIRTFCVESQGESFQAVTECADTACPFYLYRHGTPPEGTRHQPMKTIRQYCLDNCQAGAGRQEVVECCGDTALLGPCPVFPFRLGKNPNISAATREKARQRALEADPLRLRNSKKLQAHAPFAAPESTEATGAGL